MENQDDCLMNDGPKVISIREAATRLYCSYSTALRLAKDGELKAFRVRGSWRTTDAFCDEYIQRRLADQQSMLQIAEVTR